jgi:dCMP deaminase
MKQKDKQFMMDIAARAAEDSHAIRLKVGGVVTDYKGNFVASGFNGTVRGFHTNDCEKRVYHRNETMSFGTPWVDKSVYPFHNGDGDDYRLVTDERITIHAEQNLITHSARRGVSIDGGTVFLTHSPCTKCTSLLVQCGIKEIVYNELHRSFDETEELYGKYVKLTKWSK